MALTEYQKIKKNIELTPTIITLLEQNTHTHLVYSTNKIAQMYDIPHRTVLKIQREKENFITEQQKRLDFIDNVCNDAENGLTGNELSIKYDKSLSVIRRITKMKNKEKLQSIRADKQVMFIIDNADKLTKEEIAEHLSTTHNRVVELARKANIKLTTDFEKQRNQLKETILAEHNIGLSNKEIAMKHHLLVNYVSSVLASNVRKQKLFNGEYALRNQEMYYDFLLGMTITDLQKKYLLTKNTVKQYLYKSNVNQNDLAIAIERINKENIPHSEELLYKYKKLSKN